MVDRERYSATDMLRFVANKFSADWAPREVGNVLSPFATFSESGIEVTLQKWGNGIILLHQQIIGTHWEKDFVGFVDYFLDPSAVKLLKYTFELCTAVTRCATLFYINGVRDAPDIAVEVIQRILHRYSEMYGTDIFQDFDQYCLELMDATSNT